MTKVTFLGGCQRVGASAILIEHAGARVLMDYGMAFNGHRRVPLPTSTRNLTTVLSHAHLDHSGSLPLIAGSQAHHVPVYSTALTQALLRLLLSDMLRIGGDNLPFERPEVDKVFENSQTLAYGETHTVNPKVQISLRDAGHIPGSASILVETERNGGGSGRILYTGDLNTMNTQLVQGAKNPRGLGELDLVIVESTYALQEHPPREEVEKEFTDAVRTTLEENGTVLIPSFAVGRAQEVLLVLQKYRHQGLDYPIFLDGMARQVTRVLQHYDQKFTGGRQLQQILKHVTFVRNNTDRRIALEEPAIIIAPAGMLKGGSAQRYLRAIAKDPQSSVFLVGKQLPGTPGAELLTTGNITLRQNSQPVLPLHVKAKVESFDFSCHVGRTEVLDFLGKIKGNPKVMTVHGEAAACQNLAQTVERRFGYEAVAAICGQKITFN